jgi:hypothetical protein
VDQHEIIEAFCSQFLNGAREVTVTSDEANYGSGRISSVSTLKTIYLGHDYYVSRAFARVGNTFAPILEILVLLGSGMERVVGVVIYEDDPADSNICLPTVADSIPNNHINVIQYSKCAVFVLRAASQRAILNIPKNVCGTLLP